MIDEIYDKNTIGHISSQEVTGPEAMKKYVSANKDAFPDVKFNVEDQIAEGDKVVTRISFTATHKGEFRGIAPTSKSVTATGTSIVKIVNGKIVEGWTDWDALGLMQQLGAVSLPGQK